MTPERWQQIREVLEKALSLAPEQRSALLARACASDPDLRKEVETLLASSDDVRSSFLESPPARAALSPGTKLGEYEIKSMLGAGGMGEVYRARDARLGRDVAIKVLPAMVSSDSDRLRRFEQEARAAAALNHPNILAVFQMATHEGSPYLVSELLEGETLREQMRRGRMAVRKAIDYGVQIARGLSAAHEKGIVHRDLKPENLFVTKDGRAKILDFGLAKLTQPQSADNAPAAGGETEPGAVMGTVGDMSPEQVRGQPADHRTDIFSFGAILFEMLAGKRAFQRATAADTQSAILNEDPPSISQVTTIIPPALQRVVHRCLEKIPEQRFQSASDLAFALDALSEHSGSVAVPSSKEHWRISKLWAVAAVLVTVLAVVFALRFRTPRPEQKHDPVEKQLTANPAENSVGSWAISRDGKYLAYSDILSKNLYLVAIDSGETRQLPLAAQYRPIDWFPDGNHLLLSDVIEGDLWKLSTWDSSLRKLGGRDTPRAALSPDGSHIAFVNDAQELWLMGGDGEEPHKIPLSDSPGYESIAWSPTGQRLAYIRSQGPYERRQVTIETCDLAGSSPTVVLSDPDLWTENGILDIDWLLDGRIVYSLDRGGDINLWAIQADAGTGRRIGNPTRLTSWRNFEALGPQASADGKRLIAARKHVESQTYLGALGNKTLTPRRLTLDGWRNAVWTWTRDSKAILFESNRNDKWTILKQDVDAKTPETLITGSENYFYPVLSADGTLLYSATASPKLYDPSDTTMRMMSTPERGGTRSILMMGSYYYACGSSPSSSCVVSELKNKELIFSHLDPVKGKGEEIARLDEYQSAEPQWDLSPDGSRLAIVDSGESKGEIRILNIVDRKITVLQVRNWKWQSLQQIRWAADGKIMFAVAPTAISWDILSIDAKGNARVLYEIPMGAGWIASIVASPDGRTLAFTKRTFVNDVMLLENF
ncbi:MAG: protein kinase domain-containing protein [Terriglobales bacterium]